MTDKSSVKAGIYFSHYECLGHTSRVIAVSQVFKKKFPSGNFFFIQAGVEQPITRLAQYGQIYSLPSPFVDRNQFKKSIREVGSQQRAQACVNILAREKPDIFFTEFFPLGREESRHELIPALAKASAQGAKMWAVAGYPLLIGTGHGWREKILELYQKIIIFAPVDEKKMIMNSFPNALDRKKYNDFFKRHEKKIIFAGYLLPQGEIINNQGDENFSKLSKTRGVCRVAVVRGGGAYYPKIIAEAIRSSDLLGQDYYLTVVAGPSTTSGEWRLFSTLMNKKKIQNTTLLKSINDYEGLIRDCDVCVSTASYHTAAMLMKHLKKAVVIPFEGYDKEMSFQEQPARARLLKKTIGADVLPIQELTAVRLSDFIAKSSHRREIKNDDLGDWFNGEQYLDKALTGLLSH